MGVITGGKIIEGALGIYHNAGAPTDGSSGTFAGIAPVGAILIDTSNGALYRNIGTQASPIWAGVERQTALSKEFNIDNGAATTDDDLFVHVPEGGRPISARLVFTEASDSSMSGATIQLGTTQGAQNIVAAVAISESKAVGAVQELTLASGVDDLGDDGNIWARHTGIAATQVGKYKVAVDYVRND